MPGLLNDEKLVFTSVFLLLIVSLLVSFKRRDKEGTGFFLIVYLWAFFYSMLLTYLVDFRYIASVPHLFRTGFPASLLVMPASYLYVRQSLVNRKLRFRDLLHLLPFSFFVADHMSFFLLSAAEKIRYIDSFTQQEMMVGFSQGSVMPTFGYTWLRYGQMILYCVLQLIMISRSVRNQPDAFKRDFLSWLKFLTISQVLIFSIPISIILFNGLRFFETSSTVSEALMVVAQGLFLLFRPDILYGLAPEEKEQEDPDPQEAAKEMAYTDEDLAAAERTIEGIMLTQKPYLQSRFRIQDLSASSGLSIQKISAFVNRRKHMNFLSYVNEFRIHACLVKLGSREHETKTLEAIAEECGFQSRSTFIRVFKQVTGKTPSEYISSMG